MLNIEHGMTNAEGRHPFVFSFDIRYSISQKQYLKTYITLPFAPTFSLTFPPVPPITRISHRSPLLSGADTNHSSTRLPVTPPQVSHLHVSLCRQQVYPRRGVEFHAHGAQPAQPPPLIRNVGRKFSPVGHTRPHPVHGTAHGIGTHIFQRHPRVFARVF